MQTLLEATNDEKSKSPLAAHMSLAGSLQLAQQRKWALGACFRRG